MTPSERIQRTFSGAWADRRPIAPLLSLYGARLAGTPLDTHYGDPDAYVRGQLAVLETFRPDALHAPFSHANIGRSFGCELQHFKEQAPTLAGPAIESPYVWDRLRLPDPEADPYLVFLYEATRGLRRALGDEVPVLASLPSIVDLPLVILGINGWMEAVVSDRDLARRIMRSLEGWLRRVAGLLFAAGAAAIGMPCAFASPAFVPEEVALQLMRPALESFLDGIGGAVLVAHGGAPLPSRLVELRGLPSVVAFGLDQRDHLPAVRRILGEEPLLVWGVDAARLPSIGPAELRSKCLAALADCGSDPRIVLGNSGTDVPWCTPPETIHAIRLAAEEDAAARQR